MYEAIDRFVWLIPNLWLVCETIKRSIQNILDLFTTYETINCFVWNMRNLHRSYESLNSFVKNGRNLYWSYETIDDFIDILRNLRIVSFENCWTLLNLLNSKNFIDITTKLLFILLNLKKFGEKMGNPLSSVINQSFFSVATVPYLSGY